MEKRSYKKYQKIKRKGKGVEKVKLGLPHLHKRSGQLKRALKSKIN
jgi:hypothetical protein